MTGKGLRRWPPDGKNPPAEPEPEPYHALLGGLGDVAKALKQLVPTSVLGQSTHVLDANGTAHMDSYRIPFACICVTSFSAANLVLAASPPMAEAPVRGSGVAVVPANGFVRVNMSGQSWSLYGGSQGEQVVVEVHTRPLPPMACSLLPG